MKRVGIVAGMILFVMVGMAQASLVTIGTATYNETDYNLIWDDNNNGNSVIWLDYSNAPLEWENQTNWAAGLDLTYNIDPTAYSVAWTDSAWRLPTAVDGAKVQGYEGDPDNDGGYTYTAGYNLANSEMGHLFYVELGNPGYQNTSGGYVSPNGLLYTGDFDNLIESAYWSGTSFNYGDDNAWDFFMSSGYQGTDIPTDTCGYGIVGGYGLAVRTGQVQVNTTSSVPEPSTMLLLGFGLIGLAGLRRKV